MHRQVSNENLVHTDRQCLYKQPSPRRGNKPCHLNITNKIKQGTRKERKPEKQLKNGKHKRLKVNAWKQTI